MPGEVRGRYQESLDLNLHRSNRVDVLSRIPCTYGAWVGACRSGGFDIIGLGFKSSEVQMRTGTND